MKPGEVSDATLDPLAQEIFGASSLRQSAGRDGFFDQADEAISIEPVAPSRPYAGNVGRELEQQAMVEEYTGLSSSELQSATQPDSNLTEELRSVISKEASVAAAEVTAEFRRAAANKRLRESPLFNSMVETARRLDSPVSRFVLAIKAGNEQQAKQAAQELLHK